jgi:hypothetical protein
MKRLQILVPESLYARILREATKREWTVAEVVRRGIEKQLESEVAVEPRIPKIRSKKMGTPKIPESQWREIANVRDVDC